MYVMLLLLVLLLPSHGCQCHSSLVRSAGPDPDPVALLLLRSHDEPQPVLPAHRQGPGGAVGGGSSVEGGGRERGHFHRAQGEVGFRGKKLSNEKVVVYGFRPGWVRPSPSASQSEMEGSFSSLQYCPYFQSHEIKGFPILSFRFYQSVMGTIYACSAFARNSI